MYTMVGIIAFLVILGTIVSKKEEVTTSSHSWESFMLVLPFIIFIGVAIAIIWAVVYGIKKAVSGK